MATKKVVKEVAEKKVPAPKKEKVSKVKKEEIINEKAQVELVQFSVRATIPVMTFGNIQPEVTVKAPTIEEAKSFVLPIIEELFSKYAEKPRDGSAKPDFISKANVTVTEKKINEINEINERKNEIKNFNEFLDKTVDKKDDDINNKSQPLLKAELAVKNTSSIGALDIIEKQVQKSIKLTSDEKPIIYTLIIKKRKELEKII